MLVVTELIVSRTLCTANYKKKKKKKLQYVIISHREKSQQAGSLLRRNVIVTSFCVNQFSPFTVAQRRPNYHECAKVSQLNTN